MSEAALHPEREGVDAETGFGGRRVHVGQPRADCCGADGERAEREEGRRAEERRGTGEGDGADEAVRGGHHSAASISSAVA